MKTDIIYLPSIDAQVEVMYWHVDHGGTEVFSESPEYFVIKEYHAEKDGKEIILTAEQLVEIRDALEVINNETRD